MPQCPFKKARLRAACTLLTYYLEPYFPRWCLKACHEILQAGNGPLSSRWSCKDFTLSCVSRSFLGDCSFIWSNEAGGARYLDDSIVDVKSNHTTLWINNANEAIGIDSPHLWHGSPHCMSHQFSCKSQQELWGKVLWPYMGQGKTSNTVIEKLKDRQLKIYR